MLALLLVTAVLAAPPAEKRIDASVTEAMQSWDVPGIALVIVTPEKVVHLKGYGVRTLARKEPVGPDTLFPLASCSKAFTTAIVASLVEEGKLKWDDPVRKHLLDFRLSDPAADAIVTLRDLASHRTGLASHDLLWYRAPWSQTEMVRRIGKLPLARPFRTEMQYQSITYIALGQAAASAAGKPWDELVRERLLKPLEMRRASLTTTEALKDPDLSSGHRLGKDGKLTTVDWYEQKEPNAAGSVNASAGDLANWLQFQLNKGKWKGEQLISESEIEETHKPQTIIRVEGSSRAMNPDSHQISYGLAWVVQDYRGHAVVQHAGLIDGFRAHLTILPQDGYAFAILANREGTRLNLALSNSLIDLLLDLPKRDWNKVIQSVLDEEAASAKSQARREDLGRRPESEPSVALEKLAGTFEEPAYGAAKVRVEKSGLVWDWSSWKLPLEHYANDTFRLKSDDSRLNGVFLRFVVQDGQATEFRLSGLTFRRKPD